MPEFHDICKNATFTNVNVNRHNRGQKTLTRNNPTSMPMLHFQLGNMWLAPQVIKWLNKSQPKGKKNRRKIFKNFEEFHMPMKTQIWQQIRVSCKAGVAALTRKNTENLVPRVINTQLLCKTWILSCEGLTFSSLRWDFHVPVNPRSLT